MAGPDLLARLRDRATHPAPTGGPGAARGPVNRVSATSNAPAGLTEVYDAGTHRWNPLYVQPTEYRLFLQRTQSVASLTEPVKWHLESDEGRFAPIDTTDSGIHIGGLGVGMIARQTPRGRAHQIKKEIRDLAGKYDRLDDVIRRSLDPKEILIPEYPAPIFDDANGQPAAGCGVFDLSEQVGALPNRQFTVRRGVHRGDGEPAQRGGRRCSHP